MKAEALLPIIWKQKYGKYNPGEEINDHDNALGYVLTHNKEYLPSFNELDDDEDKKAIAFTQWELGFNMGHVSQGEGPAAGLFTTIGKTLALYPHEFVWKNLPFYFVHWITDMWGAVPNPKVLGSAEKVLGIVSGGSRPGFVFQAEVSIMGNGMLTMMATDKNMM